MKKLYLSMAMAVCIAAGAATANAADQPGAVTLDGSIKDTVLSMLYYTPDIKSFQEYRQAAEHD
jgi:hypothetical protein